MNKEKVKGIMMGMAIMIIFSFSTQLSLADTIGKSINVIYSDIKIVIDGVKINPKDGSGKSVEPFIYNGTTYLPVRAISEGLGKQVNWDQNTKTVYIGGIPKTTLSSCGPEEFLNRHSSYKGKDFGVSGAGIIQIRQEDYNYFNSIFVPSSDYGSSSTYLIKSQYTKMKGLLINPDNLSNNFTSFSHMHDLKIEGDGNVLFNGKDYLKSLGYANGEIKKGDKNQPVPFEVDLVGVEELTIRTSGGTLYNVEFIGLDN